VEAQRENMIEQRRTDGKRRGLEGERELQARKGKVRAEPIR